MNLDLRKSCNSNIVNFGVHLILDLKLVFSINQPVSFLPGLLVP